MGDRVARWAARLLAVGTVIVLVLAALTIRDTRQINDDRSETSTEADRLADHVRGRQQLAAQPLIAGWDLNRQVNKALDASLAAGDAFGSINEALNRAVDTANGGRTSAGQDIARGRAQQGIDDLRRAIDREEKALQSARAAARELAKAQREARDGLDR